MYLLRILLVANWFGTFWFSVQWKSTLFKELCSFPCLASLKIISNYPIYIVYVYIKECSYLIYLNDFYRAIVHASWLAFDCSGLIINAVAVLDYLHVWLALHRPKSSIFAYCLSGLILGDRYAMYANEPIGCCVTNERLLNEATERGAVDSVLDCFNFI